MRGAPMPLHPDRPLIGLSGAQTPTAWHAADATTYRPADGWAVALCRRSMALSVDHAVDGTPILAAPFGAPWVDGMASVGCLRCDAALTAGRTRCRP